MDLAKLKQELKKDFNSSKSSEDLQKLKVKYLGKKGKITNLSKSFLKSMKVERFNPVDEPFDFRFHEALTTVVKDDIEPHTIVDVIQAGYLLEGELLRPAKVVVSKKEEKKEQEEEKGE